MKMNKRQFRLKAVSNEEMQDLLDLNPRPRSYLSFPAACLFAAIIFVILYISAIGFQLPKDPYKPGKLVQEPIGVMIDRISEEVGLHPSLAHALVQIESKYNPNAISPTGAVGLVQVLRSTAKGECGIDALSDLAVPEHNLRCGFGYLVKLKKTYKSWPKALIAYNKGGKHVKHPPADGIKYANDVLNEFLKKM